MKAPSPMAQGEGRNDNDAGRRGELVTLDNFLDSHPEIAEQLRKDPSLVDNKQFVQDHPALQQFLQQHPYVSEEFKENPNGFMRQEARYEAHDTNRAELASFDQFMDRHPEIGEQLRKDPSLVDNKQFVENHPALQLYLKDHPDVREEISENPNAFMQLEKRYDRNEDRGQRNDITRGELASFDQFLDHHSEIAEQLRKDPSLVDNKQFVANHPALQQ